MLEVLSKSYSILDNIFNKGAYSTIELSKDIDENNRKIITKIVYGVLDNNIKLEYFIKQLASTKPKNKILLILKIALYSILEMNSMPSYAITDNAVELTRKIGKKETTGFVNAVLKRAANYTFTYPKERNEYLSIYFSKPLILVNYYIGRYGVEKAEEILSVKPYELEHIRFNSRKINREKFIDLLIKNNIEFIESEAGGFFVRNEKAIYDMFNDGILTFQSLTSMLVVKAMNVINSTVKVLDMCAAPGGKAVLIAEKSPLAEVTAADIHPHRIELIDSYKKRMGVNNVESVLSNALILNNDYIDKFDYVLCDVPCSGYGIIGKKPDIMLNRTELDIEKLTEIQYNILKNASLYVKKGGVIVYSTCTTLYAENEGVVKRLLANPMFAGDSINNGEAMQNYLPNDKGQDGFFIARIKRL